MSQLQRQVLPSRVFFQRFQPSMTEFQPRVPIHRFRPNANGNFIRHLQVIRRAAESLLRLEVGARHRINRRRYQFAFLQQVGQVQSGFQYICHFRLSYTDQTTNLCPLVLRRILRRVITPLNQHLNPSCFRAENGNVYTGTTTMDTHPAWALFFGQYDF